MIQCSSIKIEWLLEETAWRGWLWIWITGNGPLCVCHFYPPLHAAVTSLSRFSKDYCPRCICSCAVCVSEVNCTDRLVIKLSITSKLSPVLSSLYLHLSCNLSHSISLALLPAISSLISLSPSLSLCFSLFLSLSPFMSLSVSFFLFLLF